MASPSAAGKEAGEDVVEEEAGEDVVEEEAGEDKSFKNDVIELFSHHTTHTRHTTQTPHTPHNTQHTQRHEHQHPNSLFVGVLNVYIFKNDVI